VRPRGFWSSAHGDWARRALDAGDQQAAIRVGLAAFLVFVVLLGGTERGSIITAVRALGAIAGGAFILVYVRRMPRQADSVDHLVFCALLAYLASCVISGVPRMAFDAAVTATATAAGFYVARGMLSDPAARQMAVVVLGMVGTLLAVLYLGLWGLTWLRWSVVLGAGPPPLTLYLPPGLYAHHYTVAMVIAMLLPAVFRIARRPVLWPIGILGAIAGVAVVVMSGSRTVWVALALTSVLVMLPRARAWGGRDLIGRAGVIAVLVAVMVGLLAGPLIERLGSASSVELRWTMWGSSLGRWLQDPIGGSGPNTFAAEFSRTGYNDFVDNYVPHAHNTLVQVLFESGLLGMLAIGLLLIAVVVALRSVPQVDEAAWSGVALFAFMTITEQPAQVGVLVALLAVWAALGAPRVLTVQKERSGVLRGAQLFLVVTIGAATAMTIGASAQYDRAVAAALVGDDEGVVHHLEVAVAMDPSFALYRRELAGALAAQGRFAEALNQVRVARQLHPADKATMRVHAMVAIDSGNGPEALEAAQGARAGATMHLENTITLAFVAMSTGSSAIYHDAAVDAVRHAPWILASPEWDVVFPDESKVDLIRDAVQAWQTAGGHSTRNARERAWVSAMTGGAPDSNGGLAIRLEFAVISCDSASAAATAQQVSVSAPMLASSLQARLMYEREFGNRDDSDIVSLMNLTNRELGLLAAGDTNGRPPGWDAGREVHIYRRYPMPQLYGPIFPTAASGLSEWLMDPAGAADTGAPESALATCQ